MDIMSRKQFSVFDMMGTEHGWTNTAEQSAQLHMYKHFSSIQPATNQVEALTRRLQMIRVHAMHCSD